MPTLKRLDTLSNLQKFMNVYVKYLQELHDIDNRVDPYINIFDVKNIMDYAYVHLFSEKTDDDTIVGFAIIGYIPAEHPAYNSIEIREFYIIPEYRRKGYATQIINDLIKDYDPENIRFEIIKKNEIAKDFWLNHIFKGKAVKQNTESLNDILKKFNAKRNSALEAMYEDNFGWIDRYSVKIK